MQMSVCISNRILRQVIDREIISFPTSGKFLVEQGVKKLWELNNRSQPNILYQLQQSSFVFHVIFFQNLKPPVKAQMFYCHNLSIRVVIMGHCMGSSKQQLDVL